MKLIFSPGGIYFCPAKKRIHSAKIQKLLQNIDVFNIFNAGKKIICRKWAGFGIFFISLQRIYKDIYSIYKRYIKSRSIYNFGIDVSENDKILTLSTCDNTGTKRVAVHAKMINIEYK